MARLLNSMCDAMAQRSMAFRPMAGALVLAFLMPAVAIADTPSKVYLFAAASTAAPIEDISSSIAAGAGINVVPVFAASGTLARQIDAGAPADIYLSANPQWMAWLARQDLVEPETRTVLIGNCLVVAQPVSDDQSIRLTKDLPTRLGDRRLALADPAIAPVGAYARDALQTLGLWDAVKQRIAFQSNARAVLVLVQRGEVAAGILYRSDAMLSKRVRISETVPPSAYPAIEYPAAIVKGHDRPAVRRVFDILRSERARGIFVRHGFLAAGHACSS